MTATRCRYNAVIIWLNYRTLIKLLTFLNEAHHSLIEHRRCVKLSVNVAMNGSFISDRRLCISQFGYACRARSCNSLTKPRNGSVAARLRCLNLCAVQLHSRTGCTATAAPHGENRILLGAQYLHQAVSFHDESHVLLQGTLASCPTA